LDKIEHFATGSIKTTDFFTPYALLPESFMKIDEKLFLFKPRQMVELSFVILPLNKLLRNLLARSSQLIAHSLKNSILLL